MRDTTEQLARIKARAKAHGEALESATWFTSSELAARWGVSVTTIYVIPVAELPYKRFGKGKRPIRRYSPADVLAFEASDSAKQSA